MNSQRTRPRPISRRSRSSRDITVSEVGRPDLGWIHDGVRYRVTVWPEVRFEREISPGEWVAGDPAEEVFASAALGVTGNQWRRYLEFVPAVEREFVERF